MIENTPKSLFFTVFRRVFGFIRDNDFFRITKFIPKS